MIASSLQYIALNYNIDDSPMQTVEGKMRRDNATLLVAISELMCHTVQVR